MHRARTLGPASMLLLCLACGSTQGRQPDAGGDAAKDATRPDGHGGHDGGHPQRDGSADSAPPTDAAHPDGGDGGPGPGASVLQFHNNASRDGHFVDAALTKAAAAKMALDMTFDGSIAGPLWGQPLYVQNGVAGKGTFYVADDNNDVYALDEATGKPVWSRTPLATPAGMAGSGCGNVTPIGVTGTPVIDYDRRTIYLAAAVGTGSGIMTYEIHALSIDTGAEASGWPVDVSSLASSGGVTFNPPPQGQRSALALVNGVLYVPFGGEDGDCGVYHGWVVTVKTTDPKSASAYATPAARGGGIWAVGGMASDGTDVFAVTGNATVDTSALSWAMAGTEAVLRFHDGSTFSGSATDYFTPSNWQYLDRHDIDLGGSGAVTFDLPGATPSKLIAAFGKTGVVHLLDRANLGGVGTGDGTTGEGLFSDRVANGTIINASAFYTTALGSYLAFFSGSGGSQCPGGTSGNLVALKLTAASPPSFTTAWCANIFGRASPIVTTSDAAGANPVVWIAGAQGSNLLYGFDGDTGAGIFDGGAMSMDTVIHFTAPIVANGRVIVGASDRLYAFKPGM